ncbi:MAG: efflux RND transporter periplasmic adaptor subunit [Candidatus Tectomicrobia bacterium]|nr:efflux RND transporter periplasmic adaptor subunit [Candidatus Tectomicrobia bacterium]
MRRRYLLMALAGLVVAGAAYFVLGSREGNGPGFRLAKVERGVLTSAVSATGTLNAVTSVIVGSQVSGRIAELHADFNTQVRKDQVIARISPEIFEAKVNQAAAELDAAKATILNQQANLERARADLQNAKAAAAAAAAQTTKARVGLLDTKRNLDRQRHLFREKLIPQSTIDTAEAAHDTAAAQLEATQAQEEAQRTGIQASQAQFRVTEALLQNARAVMKQKEASLSQAKVDLENTFIRAPVDGVVVSRNVDVGQTVAASLQAPTLFTIAQDLSQMQVNTNVDEADISRIRPGMQATFTVDSFPSQTFRGGVVQIRKAPQIVQNVVTYDVVVSAPNPTLRLLPGMTANVRLVVDHKENILKIPNAALRFNPDGAGPAPSAGGAAPAGASARGGSGAGGAGDNARQIRERLVRELGLSAGQQTKLDAIFQEQRQGFMKLRSETLTERAREVRVQELRQASRTKIAALLMPPQREKYERLFSGGGGGGAVSRIWIPGNNARPQAVTLRIGSTDGSYTEVLSGGLREGQDVIVGMAAAGTAASRAGGRGLRLGF